jgi:hypothetical protein
MRCRSVGLWYAQPNAITPAIGYAKFRSRSHDAVIRVYDDAGNVIETHERTQSFCGRFPKNMTETDTQTRPNPTARLCPRQHLPADAEAHELLHQWQFNE